MPRAKRLAPLSYACYYYRRTGAQARAIVKDREELEILFDVLNVALRRSGARVYAFHIDQNELHLVIRTGHVPFIPVLGVLCREVTRRINRRRGKSGPLFTQRPHVTIFQPELWLLPIARHVHSLRLPSERGLSWNSDAAYRDRRRMTGLTTTAIVRALIPGGGSSPAWQSAYLAYFDATAAPEEIRQIERGSPLDSRILGDSEFISRVLQAQGTAASHHAAVEESCDQIIRRAAEAIIDGFHTLCRQCLSDRDARDWIARTDLEQLRSKSRRVPLPFVRGMIADYALTRGLARRREIEAYFGLHAKSLTAGLRRRYRAKIMAKICRSVAVRHRVPYIERGMQGMNLEFFEGVIAVVLDGRKLYPDLDRSFLAASRVF